MLYPRESQTREIKDLSGVWEFKVDTLNKGRTGKWYSRPLKNTIPMPVPSSYNNITQDIAVRDHIGDVWYEKTFFVPSGWQNRKIVLRVGSATHHAVMWVNGQKVATHKGGYLPFEADVSSVLHFSKQNRITIAVNNVLDWSTLPPGEIVTSGSQSSESMANMSLLPPGEIIASGSQFSESTADKSAHPKGYIIQRYFHDFFNYAGIHRPVLLIAMPKVHIDDIVVKTNLVKNNGIVNYSVNVKGGKPYIHVRLLDKNNKIVAKCEGYEGKLTVAKAHLWQPGDGYLYTLEIQTVRKGGDLEDSYRLPVGIRTVKVSGKHFLINGKPFYFKGFGKHEDADIRGKGLDNVINVKDLNLLKWMGANSFRTSHYPYSEEILDLCDHQGIVVIDESPAVGMNWFGHGKRVFTKQRVNNATLNHHLNVMEELIHRDRNRACIVMWSVANEAATYEKGSAKYFKRVAEHTRKLDPTRPITIANSSEPTDCCVAQYFDIVSVNRYFSWYIDPGHLRLIEQKLKQELNLWYKRFKKPVLMAEYGAEAFTGLHENPPVMFTEEYQCEVLKHYHNVFDELDFMIGEHVWNFADFATKQDVTRVMGNRKGVFTRQRHPKAAAHFLRERWTKKH